MTEYDTLIVELSTLIAKLSTFVNGDIGQTIQTDAGALKSLKSIIAELNQVQYLQKFVLIETVLIMNSDIAEYDIGTIFSVYNDPTPSNNGLYEKTGVGTIVRLYYFDLFNRNDKYVYPNQTVVNFTSTQTLDKIKLLEVKFPLSSTVTNQYVNGNFTYNISTTNRKCSYYSDFNILLASGNTGENAQNYTQELRKVSIDTFSMTDPTMEMIIGVVGSTRTFTINFVPPVASAAYVPGDLEVSFDNLSKRFSVFTDV